LLNFARDRIGDGNSHILVEFGTHFLVDAQKASRESVQEGSKVLRPADRAFPASRFAVSDESSTGSEAIKASRAAHLGDSVAFHDVAIEVGGDIEALSSTHVSKLTAKPSGTGCNHRLTHSQTNGQ
jgi:hypothetical protein